MKTEYHVIDVQNLNSLVDLVCIRCAGGWRPFGSLVVYTCEEYEGGRVLYSTLHFAQAMTRESENDSN